MFSQSCWTLRRVWGASHKKIFKIHTVKGDLWKDLHRRLYLRNYWSDFDKLDLVGKLEKSSSCTGWGRIALLPFWALFWGQKIPFEKGFLENPFSPSRNTTFCPVLGPHGPFAEPSINFMCVFCKILVPNPIDNYYLVKFSALRASLSITKYYHPVLCTVSIFKGNMVRRTSGMAQTSFGNGFIAKSPAIFYC